MDENNEPIRWWMWLCDQVVLMGLGALICVGWCLCCLSLGSWLDSSPPKDSHITVASKHLSMADSKSQAAREKRLAQVARVFQEGRQGAMAFAEEAVSWDSKPAYVKEMDTAEGDAHQKFLAEAFVRHVMTEEKLQQAMENAILGFLSDLEEIDKEMLLNLKRDLATSGNVQLAVLTRYVSDEAFLRGYQKLAEQVARDNHLDAGMVSSQEQGMLLVIDIIRQASLKATIILAGEMGVEASVLENGAAFSVATVGVGLVVGIIQDHVVDAVKVSGSGPVESIAGQVVGSLDQMEGSLLRNGNATAGALRQQLEALQLDRSKLRVQTICQILTEGGK